MRLTLDRQWHIPKTDIEQIVKDKTGNVIAYLFKFGERCAAKGFLGKQSKPNFFHTFKTEKHRTEFVSRWFASSVTYYQAKEAAKGTPKALSTVAQCAAAIREELKTAFPNVKFAIRSRSFSMGNSVDIDWTDGPLVSEVEKVTGKYQYGHFDGMNDIYEYSNKNSDLPQAKYVCEHRTISPELRASTKAKLSAAFAVDFDDDKAVYEKFHQWADSVIHQELSNPGRWLL